MRRLFRSESLNPSRFKWSELAGLLNPLAWGEIYSLMLPVAGAVVAAYIAICWLIHFALTGAWGMLSLTVAAFFTIVVAAWLRFVWAAYLLAASLGLGAALISSGHIDVLLP